MRPSHSTPAFCSLYSGRHRDVVQPLRKHIAGTTATRETGLHLPFSLSSLVIRILSWGPPPESRTSLSNTAQPRENQMSLYRASKTACLSLLLGAVLPASRNFCLFIDFHVWIFGLLTLQGILRQDVSSGMAVPGSPPCISAGKATVIDL